MVIRSQERSQKILIIHSSAAMTVPASHSFEFRLV